MECDNVLVPQEPNQRSHDKTIKEIKANIKANEAKMKSVSHKAPERDKYITQRNSMLAVLNQLGAKINCEKTLKQSADTSLLAINKEIQLKSENITKLQAKLPYKNKLKADAVICRLQAQLGKRDLKLREEKQLVAEIDVLNCCKKNIEEFNIRKSELEEMRVRQKSFRAEREIRNKEMGNLRQQEKTTKQQLVALRDEEDQEWKEYRAQFGEQEQLSKCINELYKQKRELLSRFQMQKQAWSEFLVAKQKFDIESKKTVHHSESKHRRRVVDRQDSLERSVALCDALIAYMRRLLPPSDATQRHEVDHNATLAAKAPPHVSTDAGPVGEYLLVKDGNDMKSDDICFGVVRKSSKRHKRGRRQSSSEGSKKLFHYSSVFKQFLMLDLEPPVTVAAVPECISFVETKKVQFEALVDCEKRAQPITDKKEPLTKAYSTEAAAPCETQGPTADGGLLLGSDKASASELTHNDEATDDRSTSDVVSEALCTVEIKRTLETEQLTALLSDINLNHVGGDSSTREDATDACGVSDATVVVNVDAAKCQDVIRECSGNRGIASKRQFLGRTVVSTGIVQGGSYVARRCRSLDSFSAASESPGLLGCLISNSFYGGSQQDIRRLDAIVVESDS